MIINVKFQTGKVINGFYRILDCEASITSIGKHSKLILEEAILNYLKKQFDGYDVWIRELDYER